MLKRFFGKGTKRTIKDEFDDFLSSGKRNEWISHPKNSDDPHIKAYVRKSKRYISGKIVSCLDIANVHVHPKHEGKGLFKDLITHVENHVNEGKADGVCVESIQNPVLERNLRKHGYSEDKSSAVPGPPNLFKMRKQ